MSMLFVTSGAGCLLPFLIFFNLLWGWLFLPFQVWLAAEIILILLFIFNSYILLRKLSPRAVDQKSPGRKGAIDVEGRIVDEKQLPS